MFQQDVAHTDMNANRWLLALKLFIYSLAMGSIFYSPSSLSLLRAVVVIYSVLTLYLPLRILWLNKRPAPALDRSILLLQLILELTVEIGIVFITGGGISPYIGLLHLTIISGALTFGLVNALSLATLATFGHALITWNAMRTISTESGFKGLFQAFSQAPDEVFFSEFLRALTFYLTAFVAGYFFERLRSRDRLLAATSRALTRAQSQTDQIIQRLSAGLITVDRSGIIALVNEAAENILGTPAEELRGRRIDTVFCSRLSELGSELQLALRTGENKSRREIYITDICGDRIPLGISISNASLSTEKDADREGIIAIFQDISDAKELESRVRQSDRLMAVAELSAAMAHEIRNPLAAIAGSAQMLREELKLEGQDANLFDLILKESSRLNRMLGDFLSYARSETITPKRVDMSHIIVEALRMLRNHPSYREDITVTFDTDTAVIYALADEDPLKQIVFNLTLNAFEALAVHTGANKLVEIALVADPGSDRVKLTIRDNGPGITTEVRDRIFEPFFSTKRAGSGLGLAIAHRLAESMEGQLTVDSSPGSGAKFTLFLPLYPGIYQDPTSTVRLAATHANA